MERAPSPFSAIRVRWPDTHTPRKRGFATQGLARGREFSGRRVVRSSNGRVTPIRRVKPGEQFGARRGFPAIYAARSAGGETYGFYAPAKARRFAALAVATSLRKIGYDSQGTRKIAMLCAHHEIKNITARVAAPEALENFPLRMDVERWSVLGMERTQTHELPSGAPQLRVARNERDEIHVPLRVAGIYTSE